MLCLAAASESSDAICVKNFGENFVDRVGGHLAVGREFASGDGDNTGIGTTHFVATGKIGRAA